MDIYAKDKDGNTFNLGVVNNIEIAGKEDRDIPDYFITTTKSTNANNYYHYWDSFDYGKVCSMSGDKRMPKIKDVRFYDNKVTVVWFDDNEAPTRVVCKEGDVFSPEHGLAIAIAKKYYGSYERFQHSLKKAKYYEGKKKVKRG